MIMHKISNSGLEPVVKHSPYKRLRDCGSRCPQRLLWSALLLLFVTAFLGCTRTVVGGYDNSPDKKYCLDFRTFGAYGHAFVDNTTKTLRITIFPEMGSTHSLVHFGCI
jgi:hypothetical protein